MATIKERARELYNNLPIVQEEHISKIEDALKEQERITKEKMVNKAYTWLLENCFVDMGSHDTDVHFKSGYIHDFLKRMRVE